MAKIETTEESLIQTLNVSAAGGVVFSTSTIEQRSMPGFATRLVNFEPANTGGYRRIAGYGDWGTGVTPGTGDIRGLFIFNEGVVLCRGTAIWFSYEGTEWLEVSKTLVSQSKIQTEAAASLSMDGTGSYAGEVFSSGLLKYIMISSSAQDVFYIEITGTTLDNSTFTCNTVTIDGDAIKGATIVGKFKTQAFLGGMDTFKTQIFLSNPLDGTDFISANAGSIDFSDTVVGVKPFRNNIYVFCKNSIHRVVSPENPAARAVELITADIGCVDGHTIQEMGGDLVFLAHDGLRNLAGTTKIADTDISTISRNINGRLRKNYLNNITAYEISSVVLREDSQYRLFFRDATGLTKGFIMYLDKEKGMTFSEMDYQDVKQITSGLINLQNRTFSTSNDKLFEYNIGNTFNGKDIEFQWATPHFDLGDSTIRKTFHKLDTFIDHEGIDELFISMRYEYGDPFIPQPKRYTLEAAFAPLTYGSGGNYSVGRYSLFSPKTTTYLEGSAMVASIRLYGIGGNQFTIHGFDITYVPGGTT